MLLVINKLFSKEFNWTSILFYFRILLSFMYHQFSIKSYTSKRATVTSYIAENGIRQNIMIPIGIRFLSTRSQVDR